MNTRLNYCPNCGIKLPGAKAFCTKCGYPLHQISGVHNIDGEKSYIPAVRPITKECQEDILQKVRKKICIKTKEKPREKTEQIEVEVNVAKQKRTWIIIGCILAVCVLLLLVIAVINFRSAFSSFFSSLASDLVVLFGFAAMILSYWGAIRIVMFVFGVLFE